MRCAQIPLATQLKAKGRQWATLQDDGSEKMKTTMMILSMLTGGGGCDKGDTCVAETIQPSNFQCMPMIGGLGGCPKLRKQLDEAEANIGSAQDVSRS